VPELNEVAPSAARRTKTSAAALDGLVKGVRARPRLVVSVAVAALFLAGLVVLARTSQRYQVMSASMEPTLRCAAAAHCTALEPDHVLVSRLFYRVASVGRKDIVVVTALARACAGGQTQIKRVVGLPGETVSQRRGTVFVDGKALAEPYVHPGRARGLDFGPVRLAPRHFWVMGDNRGDSCDSRDYGPVDRSQLRGKVVVIYRPLKRFRFP
jgi:signal peptidase I